MSLAEVGSPFTTSYVQTDALGQPNACYATLGGYNSRVPGTINGSPAVVQVPSQRVQQIPVWVVTTPSRALTQCTTRLVASSQNVLAPEPSCT